MPLTTEAQETAKAAASDFIKQVTAAEAESQGAAAHSCCCLLAKPSGSPYPQQAMGRGSRDGPGSTRGQEGLGRGERILETL